MFIRFVCDQPHPSGIGELGMFAARDQIDFSSQPGRVQRAHEEAFFWFSSNGGGGLIYPNLTGKARNSKVRQSLFWFYEHASFVRSPRGSVIARARQLAEAISMTGMEVREVRSDDPGEIIWQDRKQVLAVPLPNSIPLAFGNGR